MTSLASPTLTAPQSAQLEPDEASTYAEWFACLAEPTRVRLLHTVAVAGREVSVGELTEQLGVSQSTCSHHLRKLADTGFVRLRTDSIYPPMLIHCAFNATSLIVAVAT